MRHCQLDESKPNKNLTQLALKFSFTIFKEIFFYVRIPLILLGECERYLNLKIELGVEKKVTKRERSGVIGAIIGGAVGVSVPITVATGNYLFIVFALLIGSILIVGLFWGTNHVK